MELSVVSTTAFVTETSVLLSLVLYLENIIFNRRALLNVLIIFLFCSSALFTGSISELSLHQEDPFL